MKTQFRASFAKDVRKLKDKELLNRIREAIEKVEKSQTIQEITNLRKLKSGSNYYRIKIGEYRIGIIIESDTVTFVRCLNRKEIYRYIP